MPTYNVIGLMSGSSLDGLDIAFVRLTEEQQGTWHYEWLATDCIPYSEAWMRQLSGAQQLPVPQFLELHTSYGRYLGEAVNTFLEQLQTSLIPDLIASHGHTVYHNPAARTSVQIGDGAAIAAVTDITTITDLRNMDVALGGQGAPIVPIGDRAFFSTYDALLNLGGIANISLRKDDGSYTAFDVCPCNQLLDYYAQQAGMKYDAGGALAKSGIASKPLLARLSEQAFYKMSPPKSLANEFSRDIILPLLEADALSPADALATCSAHIAEEIGTVLSSNPAAKLLITGGGAFNDFLIECLRQELSATDTKIVVPEPQLISYKESLIMALFGVLRINGTVNVMASVTGAARDSIGGAVWSGR